MWNVKALINLFKTTDHPHKIQIDQPIWNFKLYMNILWNIMKNNIYKNVQNHYNILIFIEKPYIHYLLKI